MLLLSILVILCSVEQFADCVGIHGFHFQGWQDSDIQQLNGSEVVTEKWITQPLDHFNHRDNRTWPMRYYQNAGFFKKNGPILIMLGGEWAISTGFLRTGLMHEIARANGGMIYSTEHRYYGKSKPTADISSKSLQYLNVDQALADVANFIATKKSREEFKNSPVFVFGGSYAGNVAAWAKLKYPHLIQGALASSAPIRAKVDFYEYYDVVRESLRKYSEQCVIDVKAAFDSVEELLVAADGPKKLKKYFNLCDEPEVTSPSDIGYFMNSLAEKFAGVVQYNKVENGRTKIAAYCDNMTAPYFGSPLQRLARLVASNDSCLENSYSGFLETYKNESWDAHESTGIMRMWYHQTCTEYGYYQTSNSKNSIFGHRFPLSYFTDLCMDLYGDYYNEEFLKSRVARTNVMYGGAKPKLEKVIFTNGDIDPWHPLSVLEDLNETSPAILIKGSSHCRDLYSDVATDPEDLIKARAFVRSTMARWIKDASRL